MVYTKRQIANELGISSSTLRTYLKDNKIQKRIQEAGGVYNPNSILLYGKTLRIICEEFDIEYLLKSKTSSH